MPEGTVRGTFDLAVPARRRMREMRQEAVRLDTQLRTVGRTLDRRVYTRRAEQRLRAARRDIRGLARDTKAAHTTMDRSWQRSERTTIRSVTRQTYAIRDLRRDVRALGRERASAHVDVDGIAAALSQVALLHRRLHALDRERVNPRVGLGATLGGGGVRGGGGGGGLPGGGGIIRSLDVGPLALGARAWAPLLTVGLPAVRSLTGAVGALTGSLGLAVTGFGALATAAATAGSVGLGSILAIGAPTISRIQEVYDAQTKFTVAQRDSVTAGETQRAGVERVRSAHEQLANAQRQARVAQEQLTASRRDARRELVDMALAADRSKLSERRAAIELRRARREASRIVLDPTATLMERQEARLALDEARLGVRESKVGRQRSVADLRTARAGGVEQMPAVVQARRGLADSRRQVDSAQRGLREAGREMAEGATSIARAKQELDEAFARAPAGTRALLRDVRELRRLWGAPDEGTAPGGTDPSIRRAQGTFVGFLRDRVTTAREMTPMLGRTGLRSTRALRREGRGFDRFLLSDRTERFMDTSAAMFDENLRPTRQALEAVAETVMNVTEASRPFLREAAEFIRDWTQGWAESTRDIDQTRGRIGTMVGHLRDWKDLAGATWSLTKNLLTAGAPEGRSAVVMLTDQLERWDRWVQRNPRQVRQFFSETVRSTIEMGRALWRIARALARVADLLTPVLDRFSQLVSLAGDLGALQPGALALGIGAYRGVRGRGGRAGRGGAGGVMPVPVGVGAGAAMGGTIGARYGGRWAQTRGTYDLARSLGRGRTASGLAALGGLTGGAAAAGLRGAGRAFLPVAAGMAALDFLSFEGNALQKAQAAGSGATLGLIPRPRSATELDDLASQRAGDLMSPLSRGGTARGLRGDIRHLASSRQTLAGNDALDLGSGADRERRLRSIRQTLSDELAIRRGMLRDLQGARAQAVGGDLREAFDIRLSGAGPLQAIQGLTRDVQGELRGLGRAGSKQLAQNAVDWARAQARGNPKLMAQVEMLERSIVRRFRSMGRDVRIINGRIFDGSRKEWGNIHDALTSNAEAARQEVTTAFTAIQRQAIGSLRAMGFSPADARRLTRGLEAGGFRGRASEEQIGAKRRGDTPRLLPLQRARGGRLWGAGTGDNVHLPDGSRGAPGELVVPHPVESEVNAELAQRGRPTLGQRLAANTRPHYAAPTDRRPGRGPGMPHVFHARGGRMSRTSFPDAMGALPGMDALAWILSQKFGLGVSSGLRPGAITTSGNPSDHGWGGAVDMSNGSSPTPQMDAAWRWLARTLGGGTAVPEFSGGAIKQMLYRTMTGGNHFNHIHVALQPYFARRPQALMRLLARGGVRLGGAMGGMMGTGGINLRRRRTELAGVPGALSQRAMDMYRAGLQRSVNRRLQRGTGLGVGYSGQGSLSRAQMERLWVSAGGPSSLASQMANIAWSESRWNPRATNPSGATGLWQIMWPLHQNLIPGLTSQRALYDPMTNARAAVKLYRSAGLSPWAASQHVWGQRSTAPARTRGGRLSHAGSFRNGGEFTTGVGRPQTFVAGDNPHRRERVRVEPITPRRRQTGTRRHATAGRSRLGGGGGHQISVSVHIERMTGSRADIDRLSNAVAEKIIGALDDGAVSDEELTD